MNPETENITVVDPTPAPKHKLSRRALMFTSAAVGAFSVLVLSAVIKKGSDEESNVVEVEGGTITFDSIED